MENRIVVSDINIEVQKKNIKNIHLSVLPPDGKVRISVPVSAKEETIRLFAISKIGWIKKQIDKFQNQQRQTEREYVSGESHYVWGRRYRMEIRHNNRNNVEIKGNKLILTVREFSTTQQREKIMTEWYRKQLKEKLPELVEKWEEIIGVKAETVRVKNMLTRWGTCNTKDKRIWINLQLAKNAMWQYNSSFTFLRLKRMNKMNQPCIVPVFFRWSCTILNKSLITTGIDSIGP
jgi:predicted metal-dependent hydrolase